MKRFLGVITGTIVMAGGLSAETDTYQFRADNPVTPEWIQKNLSKQSPRLMLTPERLARLKAAVSETGTSASCYAWLKQNADQICDTKPLAFKKEGKRLLAVSREALNRISCLALAANIEAENRKYIDRLNAELLAVCAFDSWNPGHFLDVAEMSLAVSIGLDWCHGQLPSETVKIGKKALIEKALQPGLDTEKNRNWISGSNNWTQVCHGGLTAAAITIAEDDPVLAARVISRALENLPNALRVYFPSGVYPEGVSYWIYGTYYSVFMIEMCETAFGTDFNLINSPGFRESARFARMMIAPSRKTFNFSDCSNYIPESQYWPLLGWFDAKHGHTLYFSQSDLDACLKKTLDRQEAPKWFEPVSLIWLPEIPQGGKPGTLPEKWVGNSEKNPLTVFRKNDDARGFYFGAKGGRANLSHGNMDAGSFVYELDGVRWAADLGAQSYAPLEEVIGHELWNMAQNAGRWKLISKNNYCHNTITINDELHAVDAYAGLRELTNGTIEIDLTRLFGGNADSAIRCIDRVGDYGVRIQDRIIPSKTTQKTIWSMLTTAEVTISGNTVLLEQEGRSMRLYIEKPVQAEVQTVSLDPPPLAYDMKVKGLKRIEIIQLVKAGSIGPVEYGVFLDR